MNANWENSVIEAKVHSLFHYHNLICTKFTMAGQGFLDFQHHNSKIESVSISIL